MARSATKGWRDVRRHVVKGIQHHAKLLLLGCILLSTLLGLYTFASFPTLPSRWAPWRTIESSPSGIVIGSHVYPGESKWTGKIQGYTVFEDLWYHDKVFYFSGPSSDMPRAMDDYLVWPASMEKLDMPVNTTSWTSLKGTTIYFNDHPNVNPMLLAWFYHFAGEETLGAVAALSVANPSGAKSVPQRVIIPWVEDGGIHMVSTRPLEVVYGVRVHLMEPKEWSDIAGSGWIHFERIVIVDRTAAGKAPLSHKWNKMALQVFTQPHPTNFFDPVRAKFLSSLSIPVRIREPKTNIYRIRSKSATSLKVVYVDRQSTSRRLTDESHLSVVKILDRLQDEGKISWVHGKFNEMAIREQVASTAAADILLGVHGNGLTHQLWMAPGGSIVEIFPKGTFTRDYQVLAEAMGHDHYFFRRDGILPKERWETMVDEQHFEPLYDGTQIDVDEAFLTTFLDDLIHKLGR